MQQEQYQQKHSQDYIAVQPSQHTHQQLQPSFGLSINANKLRKWQMLLRKNINSQTALQTYSIHLKKRLRELEQELYENKMGRINDFEKKLNEQRGNFELTSIYYQELLNRQTGSNNQNVSQIGNMKRFIMEAQSTEPPAKSLKKIKVKPINWQLYQNVRSINFIKMAETWAPQASGLEMYKLWRQFVGKKHIKVQGLKCASDENFFITYNIKKLLQLVQKYGKNWQKIAEYFDENSAQQIQKIFNEYRKKFLIKGGRWNLQQSIILLVLIQHIGEGKWAAISRYLPSKTDMQIRQRFCNVLKPEVSKIDWSKQQVRQLLQKAHLPNYRYRWSKMVAQIDIFKSKTDDCLRRKFRSLLIDKSQQQIRRQIIGNETLAKSIIDRKNSRKKAIKLKIVIEHQRDEN